MIHQIKSLEAETCQSVERDPPNQRAPAGCGVPALHVIKGGRAARPREEAQDTGRKGAFTKLSTFV